MVRNPESSPSRSGNIVAVLFGVLLFSLPGQLVAQMVGPRLASRAELDAMLDSLERVAADPATGKLSQEEARELSNQVSGLAYRLEHGDVWPGDVLSLQVAGHDQWTGEFTVTPKRTIELPEVAPLSLDGLLYSEVEEALTEQFSRYLREPRVRAQVLKRVGILGGVSQPGFYNVPGNMLVSDVLMKAGGPSTNAKVADLKVRRFGDEIAEGRPRIAFQSLSLDQLGVRSGDELFVPTRSDRGFDLGIFGAILGAAGSITLILTRL